MKKLLFSLVSFIMCFSVVSAHIEDAKFVGGTGGSKILELNVEKEKIVTNGVIYDKNASLVYEISYTNASDIDKRVTDVIIPDSDIILSYDFSDIDKDRIIKSGETVNFKYSIKALENVSIEELESLNEYANAQLVFSSVKVENPDTLDVIIIVFVLLLLSFSIYRYTRDKKIFYGCFVLSLSVLLLNFGAKVFANDCEIVDIDTGVKYIFSNLAPSCANLNYEGDFCIDWKEYGNRDLVHYLVMEDYKDMKDSYSIGDVSFSLQNTYDVSEQQNGDVVLGIYKALTEEESYLFLVGQDGGVIVPKDASYQFTSYDSVNNRSENDFKYVKYADFSKFYSNKTNKMEYMLTGIGTISPIEKLDLSGFETSNVTSMKGMFTGVAENTKNFKIDVSMFETSKVTDMSYMFWESAFNSETVDLDLSSFDTSNVKDMSYMFYNFGRKAKKVNLFIDSFDTSSVEKMDFMFRDFAVFADELHFDIYDYDVSNVKSMVGMFYDFNLIGKAVHVIDYFKNWNTESLLDINGMFAADLFIASGIEFEPKKLTIDLTGLDTGNVTNMRSMFSWNRVLTNLIISSDFDTSNVVDMGYMFSATNISDFEFLKYFDVSSVKDFSYMFQVFMGSELDLSGWDVSNAEKFIGMFNNSSYLKKINLKGWKFKNGANLQNMFSNQYVLESLDLSYLDVSNAANYSYMFGVANTFSSTLSELDLSGTDWNENAEISNLMFYNNQDITIYVKDEKAKAFIEKQAPDCTVLIKE